MADPRANLADAGEHFVHAGELERGLDCLGQGAQRARSALAFEQARVLYERVLSLAAGTLSPQRLLRLRAQLAEEIGRAHV